MPRGHDSHNILLFEVDQQSFALGVESVQEVVPMADLVRPPELPPVIEGFLVLRTALVPVLRLDRMFGLNLTCGLYTPLVILKDSPRPVALLVERAVSVRQVHREQWSSIASSHSWNGVVEATLQLENGSAALLDPSKLLLERERHLLADLERRTAERMREWESAHRGC